MSDEPCAAKPGLNSLALCKLTARHDGPHDDPDQGLKWPKSPTGLIPDAVRTRIELHQAQTAYDLTVLRGQLDTVAVSTNMSRRVRARREQLTAELDAWTYLSKVARGPR